MHSDSSSDTSYSHSRRRTHRHRPRRHTAAATEEPTNNTADNTTAANDHQTHRPTPSDKLHTHTDKTRHRPHSPLDVLCDFVINTSGSVALGGDALQSVAGRVEVPCHFSRQNVNLSVLRRLTVVEPNHQPFIVHLLQRPHWKKTNNRQLKRRRRGKGKGRGEEMV